MASEGSSMSIADASQPNAGRIYDYLLGGNHNFEIDRVAAEQLIQIPAFDAPFCAGHPVVSRRGGQPSEPGKASRSFSISPRGCRQSTTFIRTRRRERRSFIRTSTLSPWRTRRTS